jgi:hypothetical protein
MARYTGVEESYRAPLRVHDLGCPCHGHSDGLAFDKIVQLPPAKVLSAWHGAEARGLIRDKHGKQRRFLNNAIRSAQYAVASQVEPGAQPVWLDNVPSAAGHCVAWVLVRGDAASGKACWCGNHPRLPPASALQSLLEYQSLLLHEGVPLASINESGSAAEPLGASLGNAGTADEELLRDAVAQAVFSATGPGLRACLRALLQLFRPVDGDAPPDVASRVADVARLAPDLLRELLAGRSNILTARGGTLRRHASPRLAEFALSYLSPYCGVTRDAAAGVPSHLSTVTLTKPAEMTFTVPVSYLRSARWSRWTCRCSLCGPQPLATSRRRPVYVTCCSTRWPQRCSFRGNRSSCGCLCCSRCA